MEKDSEIKGEGNRYTTQWREYDPRISRWSSVDPWKDKYPGASAYNFCFNNPLKLTDPTGLTPTTKEAAAMAAHVYGDKKDKILKGRCWGFKKRNKPLDELVAQ